MAGSFLDRERTVAWPGFNRWLVPPAALAIHLSVGQVYGFSVFNKPLARLIGGHDPATGDWSKAQIGVIFSIAIVFLGLSAALFGKWMERAGPRKAMVAAALCFSGGFFVAALGVAQHLLWLVYLGYGALGGIGLGLGYISPVSTLIKWFPDRPGLATGLAIMGFGGGALIGSPLAVNLMAHFSSAVSNGVAQTFLTMGAVYLVFMLFGALIVRVPPPGGPGFVAHAAKPGARPAGPDLTADVAIKTPQFWLLWGVLFLNVTAGIGVLYVASPMIQDIFFGPARFPGLSAKEATDAAAAAGAGFAGLLSLFNMGGRFAWSTLSDRIGRKPTYVLFFVAGSLLYALAPAVARLGSVGLFVAVFAVAISFYGGGFATIPAYLRDLFGTLQVGAIHGRLLTAWAAAGVVGPLLVNTLAPAAAGHSPGIAAYASALHVMAGLLLVGLVCNLLVRPVAPKFYGGGVAA